MLKSIYQHKKIRIGYWRGKIRPSPTEETKQKISLALKGKCRPKEIGKKISLAKKGRPTWNKGGHLTEKWKNNISKSNTGKIHSEEHRKKISIALKGRKLSEEIKNKMKKRCKELNPNWQGGKSFEPYTTDWTETFKRSIRERDKYICKVCGKQQGDKTFCIHHIDYDKKNCNPDNLITLCRSCHSKTGKNHNYWTIYFNNLINN